MSSHHGPSADELAAGDPKHRLETQVELLRTPDAYQGERGGSQAPEKRAAAGHSISLADQVEHELLPTPRAARGASTTEVSYALGGERTDDDRPQGEVVFPTPTVGDAGTGRAHRGGGLTLLGAVEGFRPGDAERFGREEPGLLPTPRYSDGPKSSGGSAEYGARRIADGLASLPEVVQHELLPTPTAGAQGKSTRAMTASTDNGRRSGGGQSSPLGLEEVASLAAGERPAHLPDDEALPPASRAIIDDLLPTPAASLGTAGHTSRSGARKDEPLLGGIAEQITADALLPTPNAGQNGYDADIDEFDRRRAVAAARHGNNGLGEPLGVAARRVGVNWGKYGPAITRAEHVAGREAPAPTNPDGRDGKHRLASRFVEWMMLLPDGHVTGRGLSRAQELARLGNGVVPLQAAASVAVLLERLAADKRSGRRE